MNYITEDALKLAVFIFISFSIGYLIKQIVPLIPLSRSRKIFDTDTQVKYADYLIAAHHLVEEKYKCYKDNIELSDSLIHIIQTIGSAFFVSTLIFLITFIRNLKLFDLILSLIFIFLTLCCEIANRDHVLHLSAGYLNLLEHIKKTSGETQKKK